MPRQELLYPITIVYRILKNGYFGSKESENHKKKRYKEQCRKGESRVLATPDFTVEFPCFVEIRYSRCDEEYRYVYPVGRLAYNSVVGIEYHRYKYKPESYAL